MTAILRDDPPGVSQIARSAPPGLQRVVHRCLEKNAERRFQSASDLAFALEALSESGISSAAAIAGSEQRQPRKAVAWWIALAAVVAASIAVYYWIADRAPAPFAHYSLQRVIDSKHVGSIAISPDGIYLAAVLNDENGAQTLLLHHIPTNSQRAIVQDPAYTYHHVTFSPDGSYIYFRDRRPGAAQSQSLGRIQDTGSRRSAHPSDCRYRFPLSPSSMGAKECVSIERTSPRARTNSSAPTRTAATSRFSRTGEIHFQKLAVCAPSGRFAVLEDSLGNVGASSSARDRRDTVASSAALSGFLNDMQWIPNGKGLFITGWEKIDFAPVSFLSYPSGKVRQITNDLSVYSGISLTADARTIATTQNDLNARFAELPLAGALQEDQTGELVWFSWLDNNTIVANGAGDLRVINLLKHETTAVNVKQGYMFGQPSRCLGLDTVWSWSAPLSRGIFVASMHSTWMAAD